MYKGDHQNSLAKLLDLSIDELRARIWAVNYLIPDTEFVELISTHYTDRELVSHFGVSEMFIKLKHQLLIHL
ncbi:hypothetical protein N752_00940 [Desulforamulus aquiferis]|nr:hypothetical protein N752_00940 [Desulforamulus aquiferis]